MVHHITNIIKEYQEKLNEMAFVPKTSYSRDTLGYSGDVNNIFLTCLFSDHATGVQFLKGIAILRNKVQCTLCGHYMTWYADPAVSNGFMWWCNRKVGVTTMWHKLHYPISVTFSLSHSISPTFICGLQWLACQHIGVHDSAADHIYIYVIIRLLHSCWDITRLATCCFHCICVWR
jgi:hypothetical protein